MNNPFHALGPVFEQDWRDDALCAQVSLDEFHAEKEPGGIEALNFAKRVCSLCPVRKPCLDYALAANERIGIWGGLSPKQRERLRKQRNITTSLPRSVEDWHGTTAGAKRHYRYGTKLCQRCAQAEARARRGMAS